MQSSYENAFDGLRLLFALLVIITHAYLLTGINEQLEPLNQLTGQQLSFSDAGLAGFFAISGFLILQSLRRSTTLAQYFKNRILRIYPGFAVALLVTVLVGWMVSDLSAAQFFSDSSPWEYFYLKLILFASNPHSIKGVFTTNPFPRGVNGSLWTIPYECLFYIFLAALFSIRNKERTLKITITILFVVALFFAAAFGTIFPVSYYIVLLAPIKSIYASSFLTYGMYFITGALLCVFEKEVCRYNKLLAGSALLLVVLLISFNHFEFSKLVLLPVLFVSIGTMRIKPVSGLSKKIGDLSYGIYIYGFLIQQTFLHYFHFNPAQLILATIPVALICGLLSWHLVEKRALLLKSRVNEKPVAPVLAWPEPLQRFSW